MRPLNHCETSVIGWAFSEEIIEAKSMSNNLTEKTHDCKTLKTKNLINLWRLGLMGLFDDIKNVIRFALAIGDLIVVIAMVIILYQNMEGIKSGDVSILSFVIIAILFIAINTAILGLLGTKPPRFR